MVVFLFYVSVCFIGTIELSYIFLPTHKFRNHVYLTVFLKRNGFVHQIKIKETKKVSLLCDIY